MYEGKNEGNSHRHIYRDSRTGIGTYPTEVKCTYHLYEMVPGVSVRVSV